MSNGSAAHGPPARTASTDNVRLSSRVENAFLACATEEGRIRTYFILRGVDPSKNKIDRELRDLILGLSSHARARTADNLFWRHHVSPTVMLNQPRQRWLNSAGELSR